MVLLVDIVYILWVQHPWTKETAVEDVHTKWRNYTDTTTAAFHHFFPIKTFPVHLSDAPWMTPRIKRLICQRNRAFYLDPVLYKKVRNTVIREIKASKITFYPDKIHHLKQANNINWYSKIKALCGLDKQTPSLPCTSHLCSSLAADEINTHYATICQTLPPLEPALFPAYLPSFFPPSLSRRLMLSLR